LTNDEKTSKRCCQTQSGNPYRTGRSFRGDVSHDLGSTKSDVLRRALALTEEVHEARKQNKIVGVLTQDHELETEFIGI